MVVADSGLVSKDIIIGVNEKYYEYIIGKKKIKMAGFLVRPFGIKLGIEKESYVLIILFS